MAIWHTGTLRFVFLPYQSAADGSREEVFGVLKMGNAFDCRDVALASVPPGVDLLPHHLLDLERELLGKPQPPAHRKHLIPNPGVPFRAV